VQGGAPHLSVVAVSMISSDRSNAKLIYPPSSLIGKGLGYTPQYWPKYKGVHSQIITVLILNALLKLKIVLFNLKYPMQLILKLYNFVQKAHRNRANRANRDRTVLRWEDSLRNTILGLY
jgi:hypothetical protein